MQRPILRGLIWLSVVMAGLVLLSAAQGGAFAGANGLIAFTCGPNICTIKPDGSGRALIVSNASDASFSGDGTEIAYTDAAGISVADSDGFFPASLATSGAAGGTQPTFSLNGFKVAYIKSGDIYTINSDTTGNDQPLTSTAALEADPAYSPDGTKIAYASNIGAGGTYDIRIVTVGTGISVTVTSVAGNERNPSWSPDGSTLVYTSAGELFKVAAAANSTPTDLLVAGSAPAYSPDGTKIVYINAAGQLAVVNSDGTGTPVIIDTGTTNGQPDWQEVASGPSPGTGPPRNLSYPTINLPSGDTQPVVGHFLTASIGTWDGAFPITYQYQWKHCDAGDRLNGPCVNIGGATSSFYTPVAADAGMRLRVQVTATNGQGTAAQNSESSAPVIALPVKLRATPQILGGNVVDTPLSLTAGTWDGSTPITFTYSWRRCNPVGDLGTCIEILGATTSTYTPTVQDIGFSIRVWITGTNLAGTDTAITNHTYPIVDKPHFSPSVLTAPSIAGTLTTGGQLTANVGAYSGDLPIKTTFVWQRCDATGASCHDIPRATKVFYAAASADIGSTLRLAVTAMNAYGSTIALSDPSEPVLGIPARCRGKRIRTTRGDNYIVGTRCDDVIHAGPGNDTIKGAGGYDTIYGGGGHDVISVPGPGSSRIFTGSGSDTIYAVNGYRDTIVCGNGRDKVFADPFDIVKHCAVVVRQSPGTSAPRIR